MNGYLWEVKGFSDVVSSLAPTNLRNQAINRNPGHWQVILAQEIPNPVLCAVNRIVLYI